MTEEKKPKTPRKKKDISSDIDANVERSREQNRYALIRKVENFYDLQRLRIQTGGRTLKRANGTEIQLHEVDLAILEQRTNELHAAEKHALRDVEAHLNTISFYRDILSDKVKFRGIGPTMAGVILSSFDIHRADTVSKMWSFAGLRPIPAKRCKHCQAVVEPALRVDGEDSGMYVHKLERVRTIAPPAPGEAPKSTLPKCKFAKEEMPASETFDSGKAQRPTKGEKLPYNAFLRTKLVGVLAPVMLKVGSPYKAVYDGYKHRKAQEGWGRSDAHRHQAAMRAMIKILLLDIWKAWREAEGLVVRPSYQEEKLGHVHKGSDARPAEQRPEFVPPSFDAEIEAELSYL